MQSETMTGKQKLVELLQAGPKTLQQQIRLLLMICKVNGTQPSTVARTRPAISTQQARLQTLSTLLPTLDAGQIRSLLREIYSIHDPAVRIPLLLRFASAIPDHVLPSTVETLIRQIPTIEEPIIRVQSYFMLLPWIQRVLADTTSPALQRVYHEAITLRNPEARTRSLIALAPLITAERKTTLFQQLISDLAILKNDALVGRLLAAITPHLPEHLLPEMVQVAAQMSDPREQARAFTLMAENVIHIEDLQIHERALEAAERIEAEEERAEALIAFAPVLRDISDRPGYVALLEKALISAVILTRRHIRARVLVALAPYLTLDLQGEALAAIHDLPSERERAELLAQLAATLPKDLLVASLAVAHTMREQDSRVQALTALANHVPESAKRQTILDALAAGSNLPNHFERVRVLVELLPVLPENLREQALRNAVYTATGIENDHSRARALALVIPYTTGALLERCISSARSITIADQRLATLVALLNIDTAEAQPEIVAEILHTIKEIRLPYKQARAVISVAPVLPPDDLMELVPLADAFEDAVDQVNVFIAIAHRLPPDRRRKLVRMAQTRLQRIEEPYDRASAIAAIATLLSSEERAGLPTGIAQTIHAVSDEYDKASVIALLAPLLAEETPQRGIHDALVAPVDWLGTGIINGFDIGNPMQRAEFIAEGITQWFGIANAEQSFELWKDCALRMAELSVPDMLLALAAMLPLLKQIGDDHLIKDIAYLLGIR